ncbi:MAG TPA: class I SAM-dependent methyltransferase [Candidatus Polarisedimenticolaceae bacterium]
MDPTRRFTDRVDDYVRFRPGYPDAVLDVLAAECGLVPGAVVADVGAGTGQLTRLLVARGCRVFAVEPNDAMRAALAKAFGRVRGVEAVEGRAEATGLPDRSVDVVTAAQAFHWFDVAGARAEFRRILRPGGGLALVWNIRDVDASPFMRDYEELVQRFSIDLEASRRVHGKPEDVAAFFGDVTASVRRLPHAQVFDFEGLRGRLLSSSYAPAAGHPRHEAMLEALRGLYEAHAEQGRVRFAYSTEVWCART